MSKAIPDVVWCCVDCRYITWPKKVNWLEMECEITSKANAHVVKCVCVGGFD